MQPYRLNEQINYHLMVGAGRPLVMHVKTVPTSTSWPSVMLGSTKMSLTPSTSQSYNIPPTMTIMCITISQHEWIEFYVLTKDSVSKTVWGACKNSLQRRIVHTDIWDQSLRVADEELSAADRLCQHLPGVTCLTRAAKWASSKFGNGVK